MPLSPPKNRELLDIEKILKVLPHRYPFLLVDRVLELKKGESIVAIKNVTYDEPFFQGHFPSLKVMPGVLVIEAMAQAGGILLYHSLPYPDRKIVLLSKVDKTKFRKPIVPGDQVRLEVVLLKLKRKFAQISGKAFVGEELAAEGEMFASVMEVEGLDE